MGNRRSIVGRRLLPNTRSGGMKIAAAAGRKVCRQGKPCAGLHCAGRTAVISAERQQVAGLYLNRLNKGMALQADPHFCQRDRPFAGYWMRTKSGFAVQHLQTPDCLRGRFGMWTRSTCRASCILPNTPFCTCAPNREDGAMILRGPTRTFAQRPRLPKLVEQTTHLPLSKHIQHALWGVFGGVLLGHQCPAPFNLTDQVANAFRADASHNSMAVLEDIWQTAPSAAFHPKPPFSAKCPHPPHRVWIADDQNLYIAAQDARHRRIPSCSS